MVAYTPEQRCDRLTEDSDFGQKKSSFQMKPNFNLGVYVNKQICRIRGTENPHAYIEEPTQPKGMTVWCGFWFRSIIGPFIFKNKLAEGVAVNGNRYRAMMNEFLFAIIKEEDISNIWLQQDGAKCHTAKVILDVLRSVFEDRIISSRVNVVWSPRSCDLPPLDYYL